MSSADGSVPVYSRSRSTYAGVAVRRETLDLFVRAAVRVVAHRAGLQVEPEDLAALVRVRGEDELAVIGRTELLHLEHTEHTERVAIDRLARVDDRRPAVDIADLTRPDLGDPVDDAAREVGIRVVDVRPVPRDLHRRAGRRHAFPARDAEGFGWLVERRAQHGHHAGEAPGFGTVRAGLRSRRRAAQQEVTVAEVVGARVGAGIGIGSADAVLPLATSTVQTLPSGDPSRNTMVLRVGRPVRSLAEVGERRARRAAGRRAATRSASP